MKNGVRSMRCWIDPATGGPLGNSRLAEIRARAFGLASTLTNSGQRCRAADDRLCGLTGTSGSSENPSAGLARKSSNAQATASRSCSTRSRWLRQHFNRLSEVLRTQSVNAGEHPRLSSERKHRTQAPFSTKVSAEEVWRESSRAIRRTRTLVSTARIPLSGVLPDALFQLLYSSRVWRTHPKQCLMDVLGTETAQPTDDNLIALLLPIPAHGTRTDPELPAYIQTGRKSGPVQ